MKVTSALRLRIVVLSVLTLYLAACSTMEAVFPNKQAGHGSSVVKADDEPAGDLLTGFFNSNKSNSTSSSSSSSGQSTGGFAINGYLWRASLDTLSFIPIASADPFGGLIISDWYNPPETPGERFKIVARISDRELRADALHVSAFRQIRENNGWIDASVSPSTPREIENAILTRARELRSASAGAKKD